MAAITSVPLVIEGAHGIHHSLLLAKQLGAAQ